MASRACLPVPVNFSRCPFSRCKFSECSELTHLKQAHPEALPSICLKAHFRTLSTLNNLHLHFIFQKATLSRPSTHNSNTMVRGETRARTGLTTFLLASSALIWASAVIVMGILAYYVSLGWRGTHLVYDLVIVCHSDRVCFSYYGFLTDLYCSFRRLS